MKVRFFQRLNTRLSLLPILIILAIFIAAGIGFYFFGYSHFLKDFHKFHLINLLSEKRLVIDSWVEYRRSDLHGLSRLGIFGDNVVILTTMQQPANPKKKIAEAINTAQLNVSRLLEEKASSGKYKVLSVISKDGRVISSSNKDLTGADWSDRTFLRELLPDMKSTVVIGLNADTDRNNGMEFLTPVFDGNDNVIALLYAVSKADELTGFLKIEKGIYKSEKIELIDGDGNIVLTKDGSPSRKIRYNIPRDNQNIVRYKDGVFFYVAGFENAPFRIIGTVQKSEVTKPFVILLIGYLSFAGAIILLSIIQNAYLAKRLIAKPISKLVNVTKSVVAGDLNVDLGKEYKGELLELKKSFENMLEELKGRESALRENIRTKEKSRLKSIFFGKVSHELRASLNSIAAGAGTVLDNEKNIAQDNRKTLEEISCNAKNLLQLMDDLLDLSRLEEGKLAVSREEFNMCELLKEIEDIARSLIGAKEIELIVDCHDVFMDSPAYTDRQRLRQILVNLAANAIKSTEVGTVTILSSMITKDSVEYIEASVADTGSGIETEMLGRIFEEFSDPRSSLGLSISKKLTDALGGKIEVDSTPGKGSVFTVTIPTKAIIYQ